ncbi:SMP-30/gluconolactonase/LRE family protein [Ruegeria pomeroyi]|uniref:SMP-30/gluconolactonase/LRE family protein n=1 Tax=Ruegeria pomeroyi TaxID=89184 RepID=A0A9Q3WP42_9RHOB|nr:SMP-30/gluconolactonase/LRE family protein [Ruegeria pomeroyi]MCE8539523.1 SMP-30/gluconolactonase/LRE family protein [Ruegeria pomeroyi]
MSQILRNIRAILNRNKDQHSIPVMDGNLSPNDALDRCAELAVFDAPPDDMALDSDGRLHVSVGDRVLRRTPAGECLEVAHLPGAVGALAFHPDGRLLACVSGEGLALISDGGRVEWLRKAGGQKLGCLTAVAVARDGTIYVTQGSCDTQPQDWVVDLMQKNASGLLIRVDPTGREAEILARGLAYPAGVAITPDDSQILFSESWAHTLSLCNRDGGGRRKMVRNFPGYPSRLVPDGRGGFWVCLFAARTHLVELVLSDADFRTAMMAEVDPAFWIAPSLRATGSYMEPLQGGGIKKLGVVKAWAPPRSYGLVLRVNQDGDVIESLHSRVGGTCHGVTSALPCSEGLYVLSKGHQRLVIRQRGGLADA